LNGTGDSAGAMFTVQSVINMMQRFGIDVPAGRISLKNVAAVIVTADLPFFAKTGDRMDVLVSSLGDAKSIAGGTLLDTPLSAPDGKMYVLAQGPVSVGGYNVSTSGGNSVQKNHPTVGRAPNGGMVVKSPPYKHSGDETLHIILNEPDFTTATRIVSAINGWSAASGSSIAQALDASSVKVAVPEPNRTDLVTFISQIENLKMVPDHIAEVIVDERTGTVVVGKDVRITPIAISHGNLSIQIKTEEEASQPQPLSTGETVIVSEEKLIVDEQKRKMQVLRGGASIDEIVGALNLIGVSPQDMIVILQAIKRAGALHAKLVIM
jgi:flagellar P-ring protein precursor FlgI